MAGLTGIQKRINEKIASQEKAKKAATQVNEDAIEKSLEELLEMPIPDIFEFKKFEKKIKAIQEVAKKDLKTMKGKAVFRSAETILEQRKKEFEEGNKLGTGLAAMVAGYVKKADPLESIAMKLPVVNTIVRATRSVTGGIDAIRESFGPDKVAEDFKKNMFGAGEEPPKKGKAKKAASAPAGGDEIKPAEQKAGGAAGEATDLLEYQREQKEMFGDYFDEQAKSNEKIISLLTKLVENTKDLDKEDSMLEQIMSSGLGNLMGDIGGKIFGRRGGGSAGKAGGRGRTGGRPTPRKPSKMGGLKAGAGRAWEATKGLGSRVAEKGGKALGTAGSLVKGGAGALAKGGGAVLKGGLKALPIIGTLATLASTGSDAYSEYQETGSVSGKTIGSGAGQLIGGAAGMLLGPLGAMAGAAAGDWLGGKIGGLFDKDEAAEAVTQATGGVPVTIQKLSVDTSKMASPATPAGKLAPAPATRTAARTAANAGTVAPATTAPRLPVENAARMEVAADVATNARAQQVANSQIVLNHANVSTPKETPKTTVQDPHTKNDVMQATFDREYGVSW